MSTGLGRCPNLEGAGDLPDCQRPSGGRKRSGQLENSFVIETWDLDLDGLETVRAYRRGYRVSLWPMQDERELTVELEQERGGEEITPIRLAPDDLEPDTLRAVVESFVLREGTDYGLHETSLEDKVAQVLIQLRRGEAHITFDPATESVNVVVTSAISGP